ncbi:DUF2169 domain-containing protein [Celeribacter ethanolicus]|uniref:DUF2169 domain-containing protein n=1 Tax=Celeribacter ethanolicus TaxID=1758178 RepID=UPI000830A996|nr:DUF2169 domain-containing protein [Celeribacter ethanolicus]
MWTLTNHTPFPAETGAYRTPDNAGFWGLWLVAGFSLRDGALPLFDPEQRPITPSFVFAEGDALARDADLTPPRPRVDLIVRAHAHQPAARREAEESRPRALGLRIGGWSKILEVHPPLYYQRNPTFGFGSPGIRVRADPDTPPALLCLDGAHGYGGPGHPLNPLGRGFRNVSEDPKASPPVVYLAGQTPAREGATEGTGTVPAQLGPISPLWEARRALGGTYDANWERRRAPLFPEDMSADYWQSAPPDQRLSRDLFAPGAALEAGGFATTGPFDAPGIYPLPLLSLRCDTKLSGLWQPAEAQLQRIEVDLDTMQVHVLYHAAWPLARADEDVAVSETVVELDHAQGFRVPAGAAGLFHKSPSLMREV